MKTTGSLAAIICIAAIFLFNGCCMRCPRIEFVPLDVLDIKEINAFQAKNFTTMGGAVEQTWRKLHHACLTNDFFKQPSYLGISNTVGLGSVYTRPQQFLQWDIDKLVTVDQKKRIVNSGQPQSCTYTEKLTVDFQAFVSTSISQTGVDAELSVAVKNSKNITAQIDNWQIDNLVKGELADILNTTNDSKLLQYKHDLLTKKLLVIYRVSRINGFSAVINLETDVSAGLAAKLKGGIIQNIGNTEAKLRFSYGSDKQIIVTSLGSFMVFVEFAKAKQITS